MVPQLGTGSTVLRTEDPFPRFLHKLGRVTSPATVPLSAGVLWGGVGNPWLSGLYQMGASQ